MPSYKALMRGFDFGHWSVMPERGLIRNGDTERRLEPLVMDVFVVLASHDGEVVSKDQLIESVWGGRPQTDDVITRCISALRRGLADDAKNPVFVETVQRRGYRVMQTVTPVDANEQADPVAAGRLNHLLPLGCGLRGQALHPADEIRTDIDQLGRLGEVRRVAVPAVVIRDAE